MGRKKQTIGTIPASFGFDAFTEAEWEEMEVALGRELPEEFLQKLENSLFWWTSIFKNFDSYTYGKEERKLVEGIEKSSRTLLLNLRSLGDLRKLILEDLVASRRLPPTAFQEALLDFCRLGNFLESKLCEPMDPGTSQIFGIIEIFRDFGIGTEVWKKSGTPFNLSPFGRFVQCLWRIRPELRVYEPAGDKDANFAQWLYERRKRAEHWRKLKDS